jgi:uncharacterized repeat protein (TIGR01451 family)
MVELILITTLLLVPSFLVINRSLLNKKPLMKKSDWIAPEPDNVNYEEDLDIRIQKDGSVLKMWSLVDQGIGNISFPIELPTPVNSSSLALLDLRVRLAVVQHENFPLSWGPVTYRDLNYEFIFDDNIESIIPHVFLEFYAHIDDEDNQSLVFQIFNNFISEFESLWAGIKFFKFEDSYNIGDRTITQTWKAFPSDDLLGTILGQLIDNCLPTNIGLFRVEKDKFMNSAHKSIHIAANWDGHNESRNEYYDQEPSSLPGNTEDLDDRWEFIAGIYEYDSNMIEITENSTHKIYFDEIIPFSGSLSSHPKANSSTIKVDLYHGSKIIAAKPNFQDSSKYRAQYNLDMLQDSGEGSNYELPAISHFNFTDGRELVPVLTVNVTANKNIMPYGENVTLTYIVKNIGKKTAYTVALEDNFNGPLPQGFTIMQGDSDNAGGDVDASWSKIEAGNSETHEAIIFCNTTSGSCLSNPELEYHASTYQDLNEWGRNPYDYGYIMAPRQYGGYQINGQQTIVVCNDSAAILSLNLDIPKTSLTVGEKVSVDMTIKNVGNKNATGVAWQAPLLGINTSNIDGYIEVIVPNEIVKISSAYIVDHPSRFKGNFIELRVPSYYRGASVTYSYTNASGTSTIRAKEIPLNIFPQTEQVYGPLVILQKELSEIMMDGKEFVQVTIRVKNCGNTTAFNVDVDDIYPIENFTIISGSNSETWNYLPANVEFSYSYIVKYPENISSNTQVSYLTVTYDLSLYSWYSGSGWEKTFKFSSPHAGSAIGDIFGAVLVLGLVSAAIAAVTLGVSFLRKR